MLHRTYICVVWLLATARGSMGDEYRLREFGFEEPSFGRSKRPSSGLRYPTFHMEKDSRITIDNMTCKFFEQPLDHFHIPQEQSPTYQQRYCLYNQFVRNISKAPIFFYTGNESPLEQYINNTGLMWELAPAFNAQVVFLEHRYEGKSLPSPSIKNCMSYSSSKQALEDFARFIEHFLLVPDETNPQFVSKINRRPVIAFGGSYGGMLSAWLRMKYPQLVQGAIAASAPIFGLPLTNPNNIDGAARVVTRGLQLPFPPTESKASTENHCVSNLLAAWPLLDFLGTDDKGLAKLTEWLRLCQPLKDFKEIKMLRQWAQTPWFDMAEGSFPYESSYIPFALIPSNGTILKLPPWPLQAACWNQSELYKDHGVRREGNVSAVRYNVTYGESGLVLSVNWNKWNASAFSSWDKVLHSPDVQGLLTSLRDALSVWYNITKNEQCFNLTPAVNSGLPPFEDLQAPSTARQQRQAKQLSPSKQNQLRDRSFDVGSNLPRGILREDGDDKNATASCEQMIRTTHSWYSLCCNEEMNLIVTETQGMGRDFFWPPSYPRGTSNYADVVAFSTAKANGTAFLTGCPDPNGFFGYSQIAQDPWSTRLDTYYGGTRIESHSNIVFSNGLLDPWTAGGVNVPTLTPPPFTGPMVRPIGNDNQDMISLIIEFGGHHTDLMYSSKSDSDCVKNAREIEKSYIAKWIESF